MPLASDIRWLQRWLAVRKLAGIDDPVELRRRAYALATQRPFPSDPQRYRALIAGILERLGDDAPDDLADRIALEAGRRAIELCIHGALPPERFSDLVERTDGVELLTEALSPGRGAIVLSAHMGHLYLASNALRALGHNTIFIIREREVGVRDVSWLRRRLFPRWHAEITDETRTPQTGGAFKRALEHLGGGGVLLLMGDGRIRAETEVPFLGGRWTLADGPYSLARESGAQIVSGVLRRNPEGVPHLRLGPFPVFDDPAEGVRHYAQLLERWVREAPEMWRGHWASL